MNSMKTLNHVLRLIAGSIVAIIAPQSSAQTAQADVYDGKWTATLVCDDTHDREKLVKGYVYIFPVVVEHGKLEGQYGQPDGDASVKYVGVIHADGSADIAANGRTGKSEYSMGKTVPGVVYAYRLRGQFDERSGHATRTALRPCEATFAKQ
jgi:hypothetical protein